MLVWSSGENEEDLRPTRFRLGERDFEVHEVLDRWVGKTYTYFKVRTDDAHLYILRRRPTDEGGEWTLEAFRDERRDERSDADRTQGGMA